MRAALVTLSLLATSMAPATAEPLGAHPALVAQRLHAAQGYDYASKFYPHPAWLHLLAEAPRPTGHHPAVIVAAREQQRLLDCTAPAPQSVPEDAPTRPVIAGDD